MRLLVDDFAPMAAFYRDAVGFEVVVDASQIGYMEFATGEAILAALRLREKERSDSGAVLGLILKAARDNTRRDKQELESLRVLVEGKREGINRRKAR